MFLTPGARLDKYEIVAPLAVGGMAELYVARATGLQGFEKLCVVKRILPQYARDEEFVKMFLDEARLAATLRHPNVIQVYDVGSVHGRYYFSMEYVHGQDLASIVAAARTQRRGLKVANALAIVSGAAAGLHHAHDQVDSDGSPLHIVHRDVSPANILVSYDGHVKVVDFGIAKAAARATQTTGAGFKGKLCYMSPEQVQSWRDLDRRSDVFSLGIVLYELTTGKPLFRGDSDLLIAEKVVAGDFARPSAVHESYNPKLEEIVMTALATDRDQRFPTALAFQLAIEEYARGAQMVLSSHALGDLMRSLFTTRIEAWELAKQQGRSFSEFVRSTAELPAMRVSEEIAVPKRSWRGPGAIVGGAAVIAAVAGWGIVFASSSDDEPNETPTIEPARAENDRSAAPRASTEPTRTTTEPTKPTKPPDEPVATEQVKIEPTKTEPAKTEPTRPTKTRPTRPTKTARPPVKAPVKGDPKSGAGAKSLDDTVNPFDVVKKP